MYLRIRTHIMDAYNLILLINEFFYNIYTNIYTVGFNLGALICMLEKLIL